MSEFVSILCLGLHYLSNLSSGDVDLQTFSPSFDNALTFVSCFYHYFLKVTGISYQDYYQGGVYLNNDSPFDGGSREFRFTRVFT